MPACHSSFTQSGVGPVGEFGRGSRNHGRKYACMLSLIRAAPEMSTMICGLWDTFSPRNASMLTTLSRAKGLVPWPAAGAETPSTTTTADAALHFFQNCMAGHSLRSDSGKRVGEGGDDVGVKVGAGAAPE